MPGGLFKKSKKEPAERPPPERELFPAMPGSAGSVPSPKAGATIPPKVVARPVTAEKGESAPSLEELGIPGQSSLFLGPSSPEPWRIFRMLSGGRKALVLSGAHPKRLRERFGLDEAALVWLSAYGGSKEETLPPQTLEYEMLGRVSRHFKAHRGSILFLDDVEYLTSQCGFERVVRFVKSLSDTAAELRGTLLAVADPEAFSDRERAALSSVFDAVRKLAPEEPPATPAQGLPPSANCLVCGPAEGAYRLLEAASRNRRALCITHNAPRKLKERYDLSRAGFLWLSDSATGEGVLKPQKFAMEGQRAASIHLRSGPGALVFLDNLEKLRLYGELPEVVRFVKGVCDAASECGGTVLACLAPGALDPAGEASLKKRFEAVFG